MEIDIIQVNPFISSSHFSLITISHLLGMEKVVEIHPVMPMINALNREVKR